MGGICPCPKRRKNKEYPYDVHEQTFEIEENPQNLGDTSPKNGHNENDNNILTEELRTSQESNDRSPYTQEKKQISGSFEGQELVSKEESVQDLTSTHVPLQKQEVQELIPKQQPVEEKKVEEPPKFQANILKPKITKKKYNPDDYRFKDQVEQFKVKKIDSIKEQQYNIDNCKDSTYFVFDITANVYIDDCVNCFIFIAPCESTIFVRNCKQLTIVAITGQFRTYQCHNCTFSLYCKSQPVIQSSSELRFTSFNCPIYYQHVKKQIKKVKFEPWSNHWSEIHNFTKKEGEKHFRLEQNIDFSHIDWKKAFIEAEIEIGQMENPIPLIMGDLPYEPKNVVLVLLSQDVDNQTALKVLKGAILLKGNHAVLQGEEKDRKRVVLLDSLDFMPEKYAELGKVFEDSAEIAEKKEVWFVSFGDSREQ